MGWWIFTLWYKNSKFSHSDEVITKWMKENEWKKWMKEWVKEWINERMNERMNGRINERINEKKKMGLSEWSIWN